MKRSWLFAVFALALLAPRGVFADPAIEYDFVLVDAFQSDYVLRESYLLGLNNLGEACGFATDLPSYAGFRWSAASDKTRVPLAYPRAINDLRQIVGGNQLYDVPNGTVTTIPLVPGAVATPMALDVNNRGVVVGYAETCFCSNSDRVLQIPFVWDAANGSRAVPVAGAKELVKVNDANVAVGVIRGGSPDGFVYEIATGRTIRLQQFLPANPYPWTEAADINDLGVVTGIHRSDDALSFHGFVWSEAAGATLLPHLFGDARLDVRPAALNEAGLVVGKAEVADHVFHAFAWDAVNGIRDLNSRVTLPANFVLDRALTINSRGWITGDGHFGPTWSTSQAFLLVPRVESTVDVPLSAGGGLALRVLPNPAHGPVEIDYALTREGPAHLTVFDVRGRRVAEFAEGTRAAGSHRVHWNVLDRDGRPVAPGAYLVRLDAGGERAVRRIAIVR